MLFENRNGFKASKMTAVLLGALMILSAFSVLFSTPITETVTLSSNDYAIPEELAPLFDDAETMAKVIKAADQVDGLLKVGESLQSFYKDGSLPENAIVRNDRLSIMVLAAPNANLDEIAMSMKIDSKVNLGMCWMIFGSVKNQADLIELTAAPGMLMAEADVNLFDTKRENSLELQEKDMDVLDIAEPIVTPENSFTRDYYDIDTLTETGDTVLVGVCDSGVDFGQSNIDQALGLTTEGFPASLAPAGEGIILTPLEIDRTTNLTDGVFNLGNSDFSMPYASSYRELILDDVEFNITESEANGLQSQSGVYKVGLLTQALDAGRWPVYQTFFVLLADPDVPGDYTEIWIDWTTSAISNWFRGFMYASYYHAIDTAYAPWDWTQEAWMLAPEVNTSANNEIFVDVEQAHYTQELRVRYAFKGWSNITAAGIEANVSLSLQYPAGTFTKAGEWATAATDTDKIANFVLAHDFDEDGYNDISAGSLCNSLDVENLINETHDTTDTVGMLEGIDIDGQGFATMLDPHGHGTACASTIAGEGLNMKIYDQYLPSSDYYSGWPTYYGATYTVMPPDSTDVPMYGMAVDADVMAVNLFTSASYFLQFIWQAGFDLILPENTTLGSNWVYTGTHAAQISSNSWGWTAAWRFAYGGPGFHFGTVFIDILSTPDYFAADYPGILYCFSAGNDGTGYGTFGDFSISTSALTVGGTTMKHYYEFEYGAGVIHDQLYTSSSKGPSIQGWSGVDVMANAYRGCSTTAVWDHGYWDDRPETAGFYGSSGDITFGFWQGTSLACPTAAGIAALVVEALGGVGSFNPWDVKTIIKSTAKDLGFDSFTQGTGRIDPVAAVALAKATGSNYWIKSEQTNIAKEDTLADIFEYWFTDGNYVDFEGLPGAYLNDTAIPASMPTGILDTDFYAGMLMPGDSVTGTITATGVTDADPFYTSLASSYSGTYETDNTSAQWFALYNETGIPLDLGAAEFLGANYGDLTSAVSAEIMFTPNTTTTAGGATMRTAAVIDWNDINSDDHLDFSIDAASELTGVAGEFGIVSFGDGNYFPIADPVNAFPNQATLVLRFLGTQNNTFNSTGLNDTIYEYYDLGGIAIDWTINCYERADWSSVVTVDSISSGVITITVDVPADALPGQYSGYLVLDNGQLVPISYAVIGEVPERYPEAGESAKTAWTEASRDTPHSNYYFTVAGDGAGLGDFRFFPLFMGDDAQTMFVNVTTAHGTGIHVRILDYMGWEIDSYTSASGMATFFVDLSGFADMLPTYCIYLVVHSIDLAVSEESFEVQLAYTDENLEEIMPVVDLDLEGGTDPLALVGPHANMTATYPEADFFSEVDVTNIEVWIPGVTTEVLTPPAAEGPIGANEYAYELFAINAGDIVEVECNWVGASTDLDIYVYDPDGHQIDIYNPTYGLVYYGMATGAKPERGTFTAAMTGNYEFEIYEYDGKEAEYTLSLAITRPSPVLSATNSITVDTMIVNGAPIPDGDYVMEVWGFTNSRMIWKTYIPYSVDNWQAPSIVLSDDLIAVNETTGRGEVEFNWTAIDPNAGEDLRPEGDISDELLFHVEWRIIYSSALSYFVPGGILEFGSSDWTLAATITETSFVWDITDTDAVPDGVYEFRVTADDRGTDDLNDDTVIVSIGTGHPAQKETVTVTVTSTTTVTTTTTETETTAAGLTALVMIVGMFGLFVMRRKRR